MGFACLHTSAVAVQWVLLVCFNWASNAQQQIHWRVAPSFHGVFTGSAELCLTIAAQGKWVGCDDPWHTNTSVLLLEQNHKIVFVCVDVSVCVVLY